MATINTVGNIKIYLRFRLKSKWSKKRSKVSTKFPTPTAFGEILKFFINSVGNLKTLKPSHMHQISFQSSPSPHTQLSPASHATSTTWTPHRLYLHSLEASNASESYAPPSQYCSTIVVHVWSPLISQVVSSINRFVSLHYSLIFIS